MPIQCESSTNTPGLGVWSYRGGGSASGSRFSFAVFQWKLSANGETLIQGRVMRRFTYGPETEQRARQAAANKCEELQRLKHLSECLDVRVRINFAEDPTLNAEDLHLLHEDGDSRVRRKVAEHRNAPVDVLERLCHDTDDEVRSIAVWNPNTPDGLVIELLQDPSGLVSSAAKRSLKARKDLGRLPNHLVQLVH